jgi:7-carboxy-7-deazaguanine synthase
MKINEIFFSIQGEGKWSGLPNIFIRTTGCNLRCFFCDTKYAYYEGSEMSIEEIIKKIEIYHSRYVCITGGEPLIQKDILDLVENLIKKNYNICLETNGSISIRNLIDKKNFFISMDVKCPSSKMDKNNKLDNMRLLRKNDQLKFVLSNRNDYEYAKNIIKKYNNKCNVYFQPAWGTNFKDLAKWILNDNLSVRLSLQIHKIIWGENSRL